MIWRMKLVGRVSSIAWRLPLSLLETGGQPSRSVRLAGAVGIEPTNGGVRARCLTVWRRPKKRSRRCLDRSRQWVKRSGNRREGTSCLGPRRFLPARRIQARPPGEPRLERMAPVFDHVGDQGSQHGGKLERMTAVAGCDDDAGAIRIAGDPEVAVPGIAVETDPRVDDGSVLQQGEGGRQELAKLPRLFRRDEPLGRLGMHGPSRAVPGNLDHSVLRVSRKAVIAGGLDLRAEDREALRQEGLAIAGRQ